MSNGAPTNGYHGNDEQDYIWDLSLHCKFCGRTLPAAGTPMIHWIECAETKRAAAREQLEVQNGAVADPFAQLKQQYGEENVKRGGVVYLWLMQGIESIGEDDFLGFIEDLGPRFQPNLVEPQLELQVANVMSAQLRNQNTRFTVTALERALGYPGRRGMYPGNDVEAANVSWKKYEVNWMKAHRNDRRPLRELHEEFVNQIREARVRSDPDGWNRTLFSLAVWMFRFRKALPSSA